MRLVGKLFVQRICSRRKDTTFSKEDSDMQMLFKPRSVDV